MNCADSPTYDCFQENKTEKKKAKKERNERLACAWMLMNPLDSNLVHS